MRFFKTIFIAAAVLLGGSTFIAASAHAQTNPCEGLDPASAAMTACLNGLLDTQNPTNLNDNSGDVMNAIREANNAAAVKTPAAPDLPKDQGKLLASVMTWIASLFAWLVTVSMIALNYAVYYTVIKMGDYVNHLSAIGVTWRILRDIGNIMLIFGFLAAGIMTILNTEWYGWGTKMLPKLLIAAVLINFSLFFAETIVDTGNLFATQFYTQINGGQMPTLASLNTEGLSGKIMQQLGLTTIYTDVTKNKSALMQNQPFFIGFMSIILFIVVAFVLFSLAFMFIARFVVLIILLVVAPIGFAGWAVPKMQGVASKWWGTLVEQTITAPVLLLLLYIALAVITDAQFLSFGGSPEWLGLSGDLNAAGYAAVLLSFLVAMGLLLVVLTVAKSLSAAGAGWATKTAGSLTFGATALAGRYTGGLGANWAAKKLRRTPFARVPLVGTGLVKGLDKVSKASFDVRASTPGSSALKTLKVDAGAAQKGGYKEDLKKSIESRTKYAADLGGKEFKDLSSEQQLALGKKDNEVTSLKKEKTDAIKKDTLTPEKLEELNKKIELAENELDTMHKQAGTERGSKFAYASTLANLPLGFKYLSSNKEAAKKIKDEARKSKDDKDLEALKKALKKVGGEGEGEEKKEEKKEDEKPEGGTAAPAGEAAH